LSGADPLRGNDLSERIRNTVTLNIERLAGGELRGQAFGLVRRQSHDGTVLEEYPIEIPTRSMQVRLDVALRREKLAALARTSGSGRPIVSDSGAGRVVGHRHCLDHRDRTRLQSVNGDSIARFDRKDELGAEMRRQMDFGSVLKDQPVDVATGRQAVLANLALKHRQLLRIISGTYLAECRAGDTGHQQCCAEQALYRSHLVLRDLGAERLLRLEGKGCAKR
jgi:hypothetical protein